jgi:hypothetical protein
MSSSYTIRHEIHIAEKYSVPIIPEKYTCLISDISERDVVTVKRERNHTPVIDRAEKDEVFTAWYHYKGYGHPAGAWVWDARSVVGRHA